MVQDFFFLMGEVEAAATMVVTKSETNLFLKNKGYVFSFFCVFNFI